MKRSRGDRRVSLGYALLLLALARLFAGCATNEEHMSERPWNAPRSWETGLPTGMMEERR